MSLFETLTEDMKNAMRAKDAPRLSTIRMLISAIKYDRIEKQRELTEEEEIAFLSTQAKKRSESITAYQAANRPDLAETEQAELLVIQAYLPKQLTPDEARAVVLETIAELGLSGKAATGAVMKAVMPKLRGRFPGGEVKTLVEAALA